MHTESGFLVFLTSLDVSTNSDEGNDPRFMRHDRFPAKFCIYLWGLVFLNGLESVSANDNDNNNDIPPST